MAATLKQRQIAADVRRAGGTRQQAADAARVGLSTVKRWETQPEFRAMVSTSPDIRVGAPARINGQNGTPESQRDGRSRMWITERSGQCEVLGRYIPPAAYDIAGAVLHVHVVQSDAVEGVRASIEAGAHLRLTALSRRRPDGLRLEAFVGDRDQIVCDAVATCFAQQHLDDHLALRGARRAVSKDAP